MKIKFSKVVAIGCALCVAFAGLTAFAANVTTTTTYAHDDAQTSFEVFTEVKNVAANSEVTYYVSAGEKIVYINQDTATNGTVSFKFSADKTDILAATAKYGTDDADTINLPTFTFKEGTNYLTEVGAGAKMVNEDEWGKEVSAGYADAEYAGIEGKKAYAYKAQVYGNYKEYGIKVDGEKYPAAGCSDIDGTYMVILENIDITNKTVVPYAE